MAQTVSQRIKIVYHNLSKGHKRIANIVLREPGSVVSFSAKQLAIKANVSDATVARFVGTIGYDTFVGFKQALDNEIRDKMSEPEKISVTINETKQRDLVQKVFLMDIHNLQFSADHIETHTLEDAVDFTISSKKKYVIGVGKDEILSRLLYSNLVPIFDNVVLLTSDDDWYSHLLTINKRDVVIIFAVGESSNRLLNLAKYLTSRSVPSILITNHQSSPISEYARLTITARSNSLSFNESLTAAVSIINAFTMEVMKRDRVRIAERNAILKKIKSEYES
jgi:DNA-binding MurR/RpiR family transcriptional regulator